ncbi:MAG TPA: UvrD-helicase domain-containing protein [Usitatibacter sp.]|nr:UvrD-helicase domain-containing protein [Usitatibacter sp.]
MSLHLEHLNPEQLAAVTLPDEHALILAGAGSGKTRVLTTRIAYLIQSGEVSPAGILAVTFTNKAAREMLTRLSAMLPINTRGMWVGTFHGLCNRLLRTHHRDAELPQLFQILDSADQQSLIKRLAKAQALDEEKYPPRQLQNFINNCKEAGLRANAVEAGDEFTRRMVAFYADYDAQCRREGVVDFAELLLRVFELLTRNLNLLTHYQQRFRYILVDEFQDTNKLQYKWIKLLAGTNGCVFAVGDDDQCLLEGTLVTMADGTQKPIEAVRRGDRVLSCHGSGLFGAAEVVDTHSSFARDGLIEVRTSSGRRLASTPGHTHFAERQRAAPQAAVTVSLCADNEAGRVIHSVMAASRAGEFASYAEAMQLAERLVESARGEGIRQVANWNGHFFDFVPGIQLEAGMAMMAHDGSIDRVVSVRRLDGARRLVHDIDVFPTHNYIAGGLVTHNSIYRFRGAEVGNMNEFVRDFGVTEVIKLEQNYRSHGNILDAANAIIAQNKARLGKNLWTSEGKGEPLRIYAAANDEEEARFIVDEVRALHREGMNLSDMALLYRSNAQSRILEHSLFRAGIAYKVYGGLRFFERQEVKHALAYLRLAANADDDTAFSRVVNFPPRGIGARSVEQLQEASERGMGSLMHAAKNGVVSGRSGTALAQFVATIESIRESAKKLTLPELITEILERSNLRQHYAAEKDGQDRIENLDELVNAATLFAEDFEHGLEPAGEAQEDVEVVAQTPEEQILAAFLSHASLEAGEREAAAGQDALQLMTVHSAKGLEFHAVFISGLEEGLFPHENSMLEDGGIEEERRLMYVAITRARKRLYVSYAGCRMLHGQPRYGIVSRFIEEIPPALCKWIVLPERQFENRRAPSAGGYGGWGRGNNDGGGWSSGGGRAPQADADRYRSAPVRAPFETQRPDEQPFAIGQNVRHARFGDGVVINCEGRGLDARVQVRFAREGTKWLALQYAKLTAV